MTLPLTRNAQFAAEQVNLEPQMVLKIEGVETLYGVAPVEAYIRVGDPNLNIGNDWVIGGIRSLPSDTQKALISLKDGTTASINTQLLQDRGGSSSIAQLDVALIDQNQQITELITPGAVVTDLLMKSATVFLGFQGTAWPEDFVRVFKGPITDITAGPGIILLTLSHPDQKKRQKIFTPVKTSLDGDIDGSQTTIDLLTTEGIPTPPADTSVRTFVRIDDEFIEYTGVAGNQLTGCTRGAINSGPATHDDEAEVSVVYRVQGSMIDLALKLMLSGWGGPFVEDVAVQSFVAISDSITNDQGIFFQGVDVFQEYGLTVGDLASVVDAVDGSNNFTERTITAVRTLDDGTGSYITVDGAALVTELDTPATCSFRSRYDTLGEGLRMTPDEVDVPEHLRLSDLVGAGIPNYLFYLADGVDGKTFIESELLYPAAFYAIPRKSKSSLGATLPPIAVDQIKVLDSRNVVKPSKIQIKRSISRNFYNTIVYKYDLDPTEDKFMGGVITQDADSKARIAYGNKVLTIESRGLRTSGDANLIATLSGQRLLDRYKFAAEYLEGVQIHYGVGFNMEVGDIVVFGDPTLQISDTKSGTRNFAARAFEVVNVKKNVKGTITVDLCDTGFSVRGRYGVVGPSSLLQAGSTSSSLFIQESFGRVFPDTEPDKWSPYVGQRILVHNDDWTDSEETTFQGFDPGNPYRLIVNPPLGFTPGAGHIVESPKYGESTNLSQPQNSLWKALHVFLSPQVAVDSGASGTEFDVDSADIDKFFVGTLIQVHSEDFSDDSGEVKVQSIDGNTITTDADLGFTPDNTHLIDFIGFANDRGDPYRYTQ